MAGVKTREHGRGCLQHGVAAVGEPLRGGVEAPEVAGPGAAVHEQHQGGRLLGVRTGEVCDQLEAVARLAGLGVGLGLGLALGLGLGLGLG